MPSTLSTQLRGKPRQAALPCAASRSLPCQARIALPSTVLPCAALSSPSQHPLPSLAQARCVDDHGELMLTDHYGSQMALRENGLDTMALGLLRVAYT
jgi:hypothetical protein